MEPQRVLFNPVNKTSISSIRVYITDGRRRPVYLNHNDVAFSLILNMFLIFKENIHSFLYDEL